MAEFKQRAITESVKPLQISMPKVVISAEALTKMQLYVEGCTTEIGWLGTAVKEGNNYYILDTYLFAQEVHSTTTEITPEGLSNFGEEILKREDGMQIWNNLKVWGHSHVNMAVSPSGQDDSQMNTFKDGGHDWFIRIIGNKSGDLKIDIYNYELGVIYNDIKFYIGLSKEELAIKEAIEDLEDELVKIKAERTKEYKEEVTKEIAVKVKEKRYAYQQGRTVIGSSGANPWKMNEFGVWEQQTLNYGSESGMGTYERVVNTADDVYYYFDIDVIEEAATCATIADLNDVLKKNGHKPTEYDAFEKRVLLETAKADFKKKCGA